MGIYGNRARAAAAAVCVLVIFACTGRDSADAGSTGSFGGGSPPKNGSLIGNWTVQAIRVIADPGERHMLRAGTPLRINNSGPLVIAGMYFGPLAARRRFVERFLGGVYEEQRSLSGDGFTYELVVDYSKVLSLPPRTIYDRLQCSGRLAGATVQVSYLFRSFAPRPSGVIVETERDELALVCVPGPRVETVAGTWSVADVEVITDTGSQHGVETGDTVDVGNRDVVRLFDVPFTRQAFERAHPDFVVLDRFVFAHDGIVQGFLLAFGRPGRKRAGTGRVLLFDFTQSGSKLCGWFVSVRARSESDELDELLVHMNRGEAAAAGARGSAFPRLRTRADLRRLEALLAK